MVASLEDEVAMLLEGFVWTGAAATPRDKSLAVAASSLLKYDADDEDELFLVADSIFVD
jgi:hypothetical protein